MKQTQKDQDNSNARGKETKTEAMRQKIAMEYKHTQKTVDV